MLAAFQICIFVPIPSIFLVFQVFIPKFELRWDFDLVVNRSQPMVQVLFLFEFSKRSSNTCLPESINIFREIKKKYEYLLQKFVWLKICPNWLESVLSCRMKRRIKELISKSDPSIVSRGYSTPGSPAIWGNNYSGLICKKIPFSSGTELLQAWFDFKVWQRYVESQFLRKLDDWSEFWMVMEWRAV